MRKIALSLVSATMILTGLGGLLAAEDETTTLTGEYLWTGRDSSGDLEAVFTPTGDGTWDVAFHFNFRGSDHTYRGSAEGSLSQGELKGTVKNETKKRTFIFQGSFEDGVFNGKHAETTGGGEQSTGTLKLQS